MSRLPTAAVLTFFAASPVFAGWSLTQVVTGAADSRQKMWLDGSSARVEFETSDNPMMARGTYLLIQDGGKRIFLVNPAEKSYARLDVSALSSGMDAMGGGAMEMKVENPKMEKLLEEPGGRILGRETTHYRYRTSYTLIVGMAMMKTAMTTDLVEDVWTAPEILAGAGQAMAQLDGAGPIREIAELERVARASQRGLPLKRIVVSKTSTTSKGGFGAGVLSHMMGGGQRKVGNDEATTTTTEVRDLVEVALAPAFFEIPAGYAETEMMQRGPAMPDLGGGQ